MSGRRFLIVSLGNQEPYYDCLHSAGHFALASLQRTLGSSQPPFTRERYGGKACKVSAGRPYIMAQSPTMMNVSGPWVANAWKQALETHMLKPAELSLVVVHDELEAGLGKVRTRKWNTSHRGHNGLKSIMASLKPASFPGARWSRISVGIGRPQARDHANVSDYVLKKMTSFQKDIIDTKVGLGVLYCLRELEQQWDQDLDSIAPKP
ncbi:peptidyl-tRNA hydrolase [Hypoxylon sp. FL1284]|nr:peptidyl-tRNA hydrolase [Hypoxylon sp. FL1284]